jgi:protein phosphatase
LDKHKQHFAGRTDAGRKRQRNEDCFEADDALGLFLVADGVGGHASGDVASDIVRHTIRTEVAAGRGLIDAINAGHAAVLDRIAEDDTTEGMGSTAVVAQFNGHDYTICWVGDSRAYLWDRQLTRLTEDHNRASELLAQNMITAAQAAVHPQRHVLTQSLGVSKSIVLNPGEVHGTLKAGQQLLLCSDGLTDEVDDSVIARIMGQHRTPDEQADALLKAALDAGGHDNVTVLVVGEPAQQARAATDLETTRESGRGDDRDGSSGEAFPVAALLVVSAVAALALWLLI